MSLDEIFWESRWRSGLTGWDAGSITTPLKEYIDQLDNKELKILIPGAGNGYEAEYLFSMGFQDVSLIDIAKTPLENVKRRIPEFPVQNLVNKDFFELRDSYDLILEQTFFCAIDPALRHKYAEKMYSLLRQNGKLVGVLFDIPLNADQPPFGGSREEYLKYFDPLFEVDVFEDCYNSIKPRAGNELFMILRKR